ncbi:MAG: FMN-binding negative transcriptional regulator [Chitinophagaceae bacterium]|nr:MAG: FMN-binding negative transcriptional regulator [Chitinophagaceae bacterium]
MYNLPEYKEKDQGRIRTFMEENPFILLCGVASDATPVATHLPVLIREDDAGNIYLVGHMMKGTDHYKAFVDNPSVLGIFSGAHTYVSASWYTNQQTGSTWNYMTVHAKGKLSFVDKNTLRTILSDTTYQFENNPASPSLFEHLPEEYIEKLIKAIEGFRIDIISLEHVFKLSQNRDEKSYDNIIAKLEAGDPQSKQIASEMKTRQSCPFAE